MVDVFISYSRTDLAAVTRLARAVEAEGYRVWWDADLPPHLSYGDVITNKIGAAKAAIVVWSKDSAASEWVRAEADMARNQKKLVQTALNNVMPPLPFNQIQYAEMGDWLGQPDHPGWRKVKASLADLCGTAEDADAAPEAWHLPLSGPARRASQLWLPVAAVGALLLLGTAFMLGNRSASAPVAPPAAGPAQPALALAADPVPMPTQTAEAFADESGTIQASLPERAAATGAPQMVQTTVRRMVKRDSNNQVVEIVTETKQVYSVYAAPSNSNRPGQAAPQAQFVAASATVPPVQLKQVSECPPGAQACAASAPKVAARQVVTKPVASNPT